MKLEEKWELNYNLLKKYKEENGNIDVPIQYTVDNVQLGRWLNTQRNMYKDSKLSEERINKLNELGMNWDKIDRYYRLLEKYKEEHGNINVPTYYEVNGIKLGQWIRRMRAKYHLNKLDNINIEKLNELGMCWRVVGKINEKGITISHPEIKTKWDKTYDLLEEYKEKHGNIDVPTQYVVDNIQLGRWLGTQRNMYKENKLSEERIKKLNELGMNWDLKEGYWDENYKLLLQYKEEYGDANVPVKYEINGVKLGMWLYTQRSLYNQHKLSQEYINKLNELEIDWKRKKRISLDEYFKLLEEYKKEYGNIDVPRDYKIDDINLGIWLQSQRKLYRKNKLSEKLIERFNKMGVKWNIKNNLSWDYYYNLLVEYKEKYGNTDLPQDYKVDDILLGAWLSRQRIAYYGNSNRRITEEQINKLNELGIDWGESYDSRWKKQYDLLVEYKKEYGNIDVPYYYEVHDVKLGSWLNTQRTFYSKNKLSKERIDALNELGINWSLIDESRDKYFELLEEYKKEHGDINVPQHYEVNGYKLGHWISKKRTLYSKNMLSKEQIDKLESLGMVWNAKENKWNEYYDQLIRYKEEHGNIDVPYSYEIDNFKLGRWLNVQRTFYREDKLSKERIDTLNEIGIDWSVNDTKKLNQSITNKEYQLIMYKRLQYIIRDLQYENINEIHNEEEQKEIEKIIVKRLFR